MALPVQNLGRQVLGRAAEAVGSGGGACDALLGEAKVREADVAPGIQQHILRLEIAVHDVQAVNVIDRQGDLGRVETAS